MIRILFLFFPFFLSAQYANRDKGEVFKSRPEKPYEAVKKSGIVVVSKTMYGLQFEDKNLSQETKNKVQKFFNQRYNGYTDLKTYRLQIEQTAKGWKIDGIILP